MKKLTYLMGIALIGITLFMTSCSKDDATGPQLVITSEEDVIVPANSMITITWRADAGDAKLDLFTIKEGNVPILDENNVDWNNYEIPNSENETFTGSATVQIGGENTSFTLTVTDKDGLTDELVVNVTIDVTVTGTPVFTYTDIELGSISYNLTDPGYYSVSNDTRYKHNDSGAENSDFGYIYGSSNEATVFASTWNSVQTLNQGPGDWSDQKATKFKTTTLSTSDFSAIGESLDEDDVIEDAASGASSEFVNHLQVGGSNEDVDVIAFVTEDGKRGLIKINSINGGNDGTIDFDVKVQQ